MNGATWLEDLTGLMTRFSGKGIGTVTASITLCELSGLYSFRRHITKS